MAAAIITLIAELEPEVAPLVIMLIGKIKAHKKPKVAAIAAIKAVKETPATAPDVSPENDPTSPYFVP